MYYKRQLDPKMFGPNRSTLEDVLKLVDDTVFVTEEGVLDSRFSSDADYATFVRLTENARRDREDRVREGDESAKVVIVNPQPAGSALDQYKKKRPQDQAKWKRPAQQVIPPSGPWAPASRPVPPVTRGYTYTQAQPVAYSTYTAPYAPYSHYQQPQQAIKRTYDQANPGAGSWGALKRPYWG
jgi:hypothetical protein